MNELLVFFFKFDIFLEEIRKFLNTFIFYNTKVLQEGFLNITHVIL